MQNKAFLLICGSLRKSSHNKLLLLEAARHTGTSHQMADLNLPLYNGDIEDTQGIPESVVRLHEAISQASAILIATPEYNQSFSGILKNALDWVSRAGQNPWEDKPVAIMSATAGRTGGARAQYALRLALTPFQPKLLSGPEVMIANSSAVFNDAGELTDEFARTLVQSLVTKLSGCISA